ncbi:hypothetical protein CQA01_27700 [Cyclobacterium qasimii]|uniref:Uncharacterized protein n=4 Tax=Cyclobacterium qasimii TaxID=1350429 RepID=A0A512CDF4_9BACT|nr:hypothetical protein CQA01_27700 [Cyclobacterium qasimii]
MVSPSGGVGNLWAPSGASINYETSNTISLTYNSVGSHSLVYQYMTYNGNFYDNIKIEVIGYNPCAEVYPSSSDGTHIGIGAVALMANAAPTGFGYKWYSTNRTTQVGTSKNFTTPRLTTTTTYYLAYVHNVSGCITEKIPIKAKILDHNFVKKFTARKAGLTESIIQNASPSDSYKETTYYDGLGRPMQNVKRQASVNGKDLITPIAYDPFGRKAKEYLPYFETTGIQDGSFRSNALATQTDRSIAIYGDVFAYSEKAFEPSPLNRLEKQTAPGEAWKMGSGHEIKFARRTNDNNPEGINDQVRLFRVNAEGLPFSEGIYSPGELWVEISDDEDDNRTLTYTDKQGKIILKKQQETADKESQGPVGWLSTYYVYDYFDKLRVVIPPQASKILSEIGWDQSVNSDLANAQYFLYRYDARKRLIKKKVPAKQASHMVYDQQDRLVGFQDGNLAAKPSMNWLFTKYDGLGRIIRTGFTTDKRNREELQAYLDTQSGNNARTTANTAHTRSESDISSVKYDGYKVYLASKSIRLRAGFRMKATINQSFNAYIGENEQEDTDKTWPTTEDNILTVNYYDSYQLLEEYSYKPPGGFLKSFEDHATIRVRGLQTGKKVKNLETGVFYTTAMYYDEKGQLIQALSEQQLGGTIRQSIAYNFEGQPIETVVEQNHPSPLQIYRTMKYHVSGSLASMKHGINISSEDQMQTLATYTYNDLGQQTVKLFGNDVGDQNYDYSIRGWLKSLGSTNTGVFKQDFYYHSGSEEKHYNGNIAGIEWSGQDGKSRSYAYQYDNANRLLAAKFNAAGENNHYSLQGISYDANGNILTMARFNEKSNNTYGKVDDLTYKYDSNEDLGGSYSNKLLRVQDGLVSNTYTAKDFKPNTGSQEDYSYDANGNQTTNPDKRISKISYNHLNLPEEITFSTGGKINFAYDAEGNKLSQTVKEGNGKPSQTRDYIGELVFLDGNLDYMIHEEGRVTYESGVYQYEYFVKDHLGNVRQVLRQPKTETKLATMESQHATKEKENFSGLSASRQTDVEQNVTLGGDKVAWLNAERGRILGPSSTQKVFAGDNIHLRVFGKYQEDKIQKTNAAGFLSSGGKNKILNDLNELSKSSQQAGTANPITLLNMIGIVTADLQQKETPEAYLLYALYDSDNNRYEVGKQLLSRKAANQHEILEEKLYISRDGYMETVVVNETAEDVWFDDFSISRTPSIVIQETHYDPWGLELTGLGYQNGGLDENKYLYNGKELIEDNGLEHYDYGARMYDPVLGRWGVVDPLADLAPGWTPYRAFFNNPITYIDPTGLFETRAEAKEYRKEHGIRGRIQKDSDGLFAINDRKNSSSYFKDSSLDGFDNLIGRGEDGVIKSVLVTPEESNSTARVVMIIDGTGGFGQGMVQSGGSIRVRNGAYNGNQLSPKYYQSGWTGGSRAQITTYNMTRVGSNIGRGSLYGSLVLGAYNINEANIQDGRSFRYNTQMATAQTAGGIAGGWAGAKGGAAAGAAIGVWFWGAGAIPGAIIGGVFGGVAGGWIGSETAGAVVNEIHYRK